MAEPGKPYPLSLVVDYPEGTMNRLTTFFRFATIIPIGIIAALVIGPSWGGEHAAWRWPFAAGSFLFVPTLLMLLFRWKYPRWWFDWNVAITRFGGRVGAYAALLTDRYPSTEEEQSVHISIDYPDARKDLLPGMPLVKWFLAIPHWFILAFLAIAAAFCVVISWFAILVPGRYPRAFFDFVVGVGRWSLRAVGYAFMLVTDVYPPFSLK